MKTALILGASGLVGSYCLRELLADPEYSRVLSWGRREIQVQHPKLTQWRVDFDRLGETTGSDSIDDVFCCLGTTIRKAGSQQAFSKVDLEYPRQAAQQARARGARRFFLVSSVGANPRGGSFYLRTKGRLEGELAELGFWELHRLRPSLLLGKRQESRPIEKISTVLTRPLAKLLAGPLAKYRPIEAERVGQALVGAADKARGAGTYDYEGRSIVDATSWRRALGPG